MKKRAQFKLIYNKYVNIFHLNVKQIFLNIIPTAVFLEIKTLNTLSCVTLSYFIVKVFGLVLNCHPALTKVMQRKQTDGHIKHEYAERMTADTVSNSPLRLPPSP